MKEPGSKKTSDSATAKTTKSAIQTSGKTTKSVKKKQVTKKRKSEAKPMEEKKIQTVKHAGGRPTKFTHEVTSKILMAIRAGNYVETAAAWAGVSKQTIYEWLRTGATQAIGKYREFSDAVAEAMAHAEINDVAAISQAAQGYKDAEGRVVRPGNWQAAAWRLERRNPARWGRKDRAPFNPEDEIDYESLTDEELDYVIATGRLPDKR